MTNLNIAYTIGYVTSFICNFFLTSYFTFRSNPSLKRALGFGGSHLVNYLIHMGLFKLLSGAPPQCSLLLLLCDRQS